LSYGSRTARLVAFSALVTPRLAPHSGQSKWDNDPNLQSDTELTGSVITRGVFVSTVSPHPVIPSPSPQPCLVSNQQRQTRSRGKASSVHSVVSDDRGCRRK